jgi:N-acetylmuramic acid 6-phosphate etherase
MQKTTESASNYSNLEQMNTLDLLTNINKEDHFPAIAVEKAIPEIESFVNTAFEKMKIGGRLFYVGAGTSGRLGILDASECPPTYGVPQGLVIGIIAGGDQAIRKAVEFAEDNTEQCWKDLQAHSINQNDVVVGITASGTTPYVLGGMNACKMHGIITAGITCNNEAPLSQVVDFPIVAIVGPEFVTGSTRMKAGTAQKLILNMISTSLMIKLGKVKGNKMVDMQLSNHKLINRGIKIIMDELKVDEITASALLNKHGNVRKAIQNK